MQYTHILMDLDGTVFDFDKAEERAFKSLCAEFDIACTHEVYNFYKEANAERWRQYEKGILKKEDVLRLRFVDFLENYKLERDSELMGKRFIELLVKNTVLFPHAREVLKETGRRFILDAVTNATVEAQMQKLEITDTKELFHKLFISGEIGFPKPSKEFFDFVFDYYNGVPKEEFLLVGDSLTADIKGANLSGIKSVWVRNNKTFTGDAAPDYIIESIEELGSLLKEE